MPPPCQGQMLTPTECVYLGSISCCSGVPFHFRVSMVELVRTTNLKNGPMGDWDAAMLYWEAFPRWFLGVRVCVCPLHASTLCHFVTLPPIKMAS
jgi:hypothetical protein